MTLLRSRPERLGCVQKRPFVEHFYDNTFTGQAGVGFVLALGVAFTVVGTWLWAVTCWGTVEFVIRCGKIWPDSMGPLLTNSDVCSSLSVYGLPGIGALNLLAWAQGILGRPR